MNLYYIQMFRYGDRTAHSYIAAFTDSLELAQKYKQDEEEFRGGKYEGVIFQSELNKWRDAREVR